MTGGESFDDAGAGGLERLYQTPDVVEQRRRTVELLGLRQGERVLDVGAGPGLLVADMAALVGPTGQVTGLEISDSMLALARQRRATLPVPERITLVAGNANELPFPDGSFDVATSTQVYEYVPQVELALAELDRVLRPGGRALILDTDWTTAIWNTKDQARMDRVLAVWMERFADAHLPRSLSPLLREAGFRIRERHALVLLDPDYDPDSYGAASPAVIAEYVSGRGGLDAAEVQAWLDELAELGAEGHWFFSMNRYLFLAQKPGES